MTAYYNENEPYAAQWLRNLIKAGHIAPGDVDERSIADVKPSDLAGYRQCHFFAGVGVWSHALRRAGVGDDVQVWTGSAPCQPFSHAGKRKGLDDERHLWPLWGRLVEECRPDIIFGEQVSGTDGRAWWDVVAGDLEGLGYAAAALDTCTAGVGGFHVRQRLYWVAHAGQERRNGVEVARGGEVGDVAHAVRKGWEGLRQERFRRAKADGWTELASRRVWGDVEWIACSDGKARPAEPGTFPLAHGAPQRVGRLRAYGNGLCAPQAEAFIRAVIDVVDV